MNATSHANVNVNANANDTTIARPAQDGAAKARSTQRAAPLVDVYENKDEIRLVADVPGATPERVRVSLDKGKLTLEADRPSPQGGPALQAEYRARDYRRVFSVPDGVDASKIEATLVAGVLTVRLPKSEAVKARQIKVTAG